MPLLTTHILTFLTLLLTILTLPAQVDAICPGFNYAVWRSPPIPEYDNMRQYGVSGPKCLLDASITCSPGNPCDCPYLACSASPATIIGFHDLKNDLYYDCRDDVRKGSCNFKGVHDFVIEKCCRNDGRKNKERGLINDEQFEVINATNAMLDRHIEEYESALKKRGGAGDVDLVRKRQEREMEEAEKREMDAGLKSWT